MNVLHLISSNGMYGAERVIVTLSKALEANGHRSIVGAFENAQNPNTEVLTEARRQGLTTEEISCKGRIDLDAISRIRELFSRYQPDIVHTHGYKSDFFAWLAARRNGIKLIATCHNWLDNDLAASLYGKLDRRILRCFDMTVAVSPSVAQILREAGVAESRIRLIDNGIDTLQFAGASPTLRAELPEANCVVGVVARLAPEKGIHDLLKAAAMLRGRTRGVLFTLVGDGPQRMELEAAVHELGLAQDVLFVGRRDDMAGVYASFDILVQPSLKEGLPMALLEALAARRAVVATCVGAVPSVIIHGKTGVLVPPGDPEALADAIARLVEDRSMRHEFGCAGQRLIESRFSAARLAGDYLSLYEQVAARGTAVSEQARI